MLLIIQTDPSYNCASINWGFLKQFQKVLKQKHLCKQWISSRSLLTWNKRKTTYYSDVIMGSMAYQITGVSIVCSAVCSSADQRKHQSSASLGLMRGNHRWLVDSPHDGQWHRKCFHLMTSSKIRISILLISFYNWSRNNAETTWPPFRRRHFQMHFLEWECMNFA